MMKAMIRIMQIGIIVFSLLNFSGTIFAWDPDPTHKDITEYAAKNSVLSKAKDDYLKNLGFKNGLDELFKWKKPNSLKKWLQEGSALEDKWGISGMRSKNHFHDPLKDWGSAGLADYFSGESSLLWAQDGIRQSDYPVNVNGVRHN